MTTPSDTSGHASRIREAFVRRFTQSAPRHPAMVDAMAESCLARRSGEAKVTLHPAGKHGPGLLVTVNDDMPYLVDTVLLCLRRLGYRFGRTLHPVVPIKRDADGLALSMSGSRIDSVICVELLDDVEPRALRAMLDDSLRSVQLAVQAEPAIRQKMTTLSQAIPDSAWEIKAFISWLMEGHFLPLGLSIWKQAGKAPTEQAQSFGLARHDEWPEIGALVDAALSGADASPPLCVTKLARTSPVVRECLTDAVLLRVDDESGSRMVVLSGLFDPPLASIAAREIPYLRRKVARTIEVAGVVPLSHDEKHLRRIVEILPRETLFMEAVEGILGQAKAILEREETPVPCCFTNRLPCSPLTSALVMIPKGRFHPELEAPIGSILEAQLGGRVLSHLVQVDEYGHARLQAHLLGAEPTPAALADVEAALATLLRSWDDELDEALSGLEGPDGYWQARYWGAFPPSYRTAFTAADAVADIAHLDHALASGKPVPRFDRRGLTLFSPRGPVPLSAVLPVAEGIGLRSLSQSSHVISLPREDDVWVQIFEMEADTRLADDDGLWRDITEVFEAVGDGRLESDSLNALVITARLSWREVALARAIARYLRQVENSLSMVHMGRVLNRNGAFVRALIDAFHARLDPKGTAQTDRWQSQLADQQAAIIDGEDDRICEFFRLVVMAVLRTNYYRKGNGSSLDRIALKLNSGALAFLPQPVPFVETWVYSPRVEGIHLRGGPVARGGLRWSDRPDDFRTEILGLLKAQRVKNAVIVPVGAKGGFVLRKPPTEGGRDALQAEALACYGSFIRGLLDITDNIRDGQVVSPPDTVILDGQDPYLVVAADKGTATFSDTANGIAAEYGFWLDDAFASGGSAGYDHKAMGITARGAWVAVRHHFLAMGTDPDREEITVAGVGDMSGDVFGNGMLLSRHIRLIAAFDHRHIFIDPTPDAAASWSERDRMFRLPRSSWADYDRALLSPGGGIFERSAKTITLSDAARQALGLETAILTPAALIRAILGAPVDLLWFGGIGTYVKSKAESHAEAGDKACDSIRVDACTLRAKVVGEGANLGMTQRGRIEFARQGGHINTDAIDNSAGVDCSDHEVNIKILVDLAMAEGRLEPARRNAVLAAMTDDVARLVLDDNVTQTRALTLMEQQSGSALDDYMRLMRRLEREIGLDRGIEFLPGDEALGERGVVGEGLFRPELAVILAYTKMWVYRELIRTDLPEAPLAQGALETYFPTEIQAIAAGQATHHRLRREIVATSLTNRVVDHLGPLFIPKVMERSGAGFARVFGAVLAARAALNLDGLWEAISDRPDQVWILATVAGELEKLVVRLLARTDNLEAATCLLNEGRNSFLPLMESLLPDHPKAVLSETRTGLIADGLPAAWADTVACLGWFSRYPDLAYVSKSLGLAVEKVAHVHFRIGEVCHLDLVRRAAEGIRARTQWHRLAASALIDDTDDLQAMITETVLRDHTEQDPGPWLRDRSAVLAEIDRTVGEVAAGRDPDLAALIVVGRQIRGGLCR